MEVLGLIMVLHSPDSMRVWAGLLCGNLEPLNDDVPLQQIACSGEELIESCIVYQILLVRCGAQTSKVLSFADPLADDGGNACAGGGASEPLAPTNTVNQCRHCIDADRRPW